MHKFFVCNNLGYKFPFNLGSKFEQKERAPTFECPSETVSNIPSYPARSFPAFFSSASALAISRSCAASPASIESLLADPSSRA